jgi:hypothetical protein
MLWAAGWDRTADFMNIEADEVLTFDTGAGDVRKEIGRLEARLDELAEGLARCQKFTLVAQIALVGGAIWLVAAIVGLLTFDPVAFMAAVAGVIGGIVLYGSNMTTAQEMEAEMKAAEAKRTALIGALDLRVVSGGG